MTLHQKITVPPLFLASVMSVAEARIALSAGADIIDCKDPNQGALGALPVATVAAIRAAVPRDIPVSATIGDLPSDPAIILSAAEAMAASGADILKIGFFQGGQPRAAIAALGASDAGLPPLVGLLLADRAPDLTLIEDMARAGFVGVMLDTADKSAGALPDVLPADQLAVFLSTALAQGLFAGLAGSLRIAHIPALVNLHPDILGFRGAICAGTARTAALDPAAAATVRAQIPRRSAAACRGLFQGAIPA